MDKPEEKHPDEKPASFWHRVYLTVVITTVLVIAALWTFSIFFSNK